MSPNTNPEFDEWLDNQLAHAEKLLADMEKRTENGRQSEHLSPVLDPVDTMGHGQGFKPATGTVYVLLGPLNPLK